MKMLVHVCCAPCLIYPLQVLREEGNEVRGFFYNPNIHPFSEYLRRKESLKAYSTKAGIEVIYPKYDVEIFFRRVAFKEEKDLRCRICWQVRLEQTADFARANGYDAFSTTLLVSPYQRHSIIREIGEEIAKRTSFKFYYRDFRSGYRQSVPISKDEGLYRQRYCGCIYSEIERNHGS